MARTGFLSTFKTRFNIFLVDKLGFLNLLRNYSALSPEETNALIQLQEQFPFSQVVHHLAARAAQDQQLADREHQLHQSAIYATDRAVLKWVMTSPRTERVAVPEPAQPSPADVPAAPENPVVHTPEIPLADHLVTLEEVQADVARLKELQLDFEAKFVTGKGSVQTLSEALATPDLAKPQISVSEQASTPEVHIRPAAPADVFIHDIQTKKKKTGGETVKQKEQGEIIDHFIKTQPTIARPKREAEPEQKPDLSTESLHHFGESVISETLVEVLLKQGKREKAIEVLKKLIWKFPQKKAYFAAQIEDLKK